ncbi:MAG: helix-turn-helix transcriptional regulator [Vulcanimicrobiaceae bacterium]
MSARAQSGRPSKLALLLRLLAALDEGRHDFESLKRRVDLDHPPSTRSLRRYLATLSEAGFPWRYERAGGTYGFADGYSLRRLELTGRELLGLSTLRGIARSLGGNLGASIDEVTERLVRVADRSAVVAAERPAVRVQLAEPRLDPERSAAFELLQRAQRERQSVRFAYVDKRGSGSRRHVDLYGFVVSSGRIYAVAFDRGRGARRVFALDNISEIERSPQRYSIPDDFVLAQFADRSPSGVWESESEVQVTVRYSAVVARAAEAERVVREQKAERGPDGMLTIAYSVADPAEFVRWTLKWGAQAEIVEPADVRALARRTVAELAAVYR